MDAEKTNVSQDQRASLVKTSTDADLIKNFLALRDGIAAQKKAFEEQLRAAVGMKDIIEAELLERLNAQGVQSVKAPFGTAFRKKHTSAVIKDPAVFKNFVVAQEQWDMVDWRANVPAVEEFIEKTEQVPPGLNISSIFVVNVRKSGK